MEIPKPLNTHLIIAIIVGLIVFGITWRLVPHLPNFAPIGAIALLIGRAFGWKQSLLAVLTIMAVSDLLLGGYAGMEWTWLGLGLIAGVGVAVRRLPLLWRIGAGALGASLTFFVASNFGTWLTSGMYSHDIAGLIQCYVAALPFLRTTIVSDLLFSGLLLSAYEVVLTQRDNNTKHESVHPILTAKTTDPQSALD